MSILSTLKKLVPRLLRSMDRPFKVPVQKQEKYLLSFPDPKDDIERAFFQYKCQRVFWGTGFHLMASVSSLILLPILWLKLQRKVGPIWKEGNENIDLLILAEEMPKNIFPDSIFAEYKTHAGFALLDGMALSNEDKELFMSVWRRHPLSPYFLYKCLAKMASYSYQIQLHSPKAIATAGGEFTFTSSFLTLYCNRQNIQHINTMHGEMFYYILDAFCHFNKFYVWDSHYIELLHELKAESDEFIITPPRSVLIDFEKVDISGMKVYDYKYYLQLQDDYHLSEIAKALKTLKEKGAAVCVRYHPRTADVSKIYKYFNEDEVEDPKLVGFEKSLKAAGNVIAENSTVLYQAYMSGRNAVIDDVTDKIKFRKLQDMKYIMLSKGCTLLSSCMET